MYNCVRVEWTSLKSVTWWAVDAGTGSSSSAAQAYLLDDVGHLINNKRSLK